MSPRHGGPRRYAISIKGVVVRDGKVLLLRNERDEWELPGGRIELGETPQECVAREIAEETQWRVAVGPILDTWMYHVSPEDGHVFIVTYGCHLMPGADTGAASLPVLSHEHKEVGLFDKDEVPALPMPEGYRRSIAFWYASLATDNSAE